MSGSLAKKQTKQNTQQEKEMEFTEEEPLYPPVSETITSIFKSIAYDETDIERLR